MTRARAAIGAMFSLALVAGAGFPAAAQSPGTPASLTTVHTVKTNDLRLEWEVVTTRGEYRNVCGRVFNDRIVPARHVFVQFEGLDGSGQVVSKRFVEVVGDVPVHGYAVFCMQVSTKGDSYRVTVPTVEWGMAASGQ
ncbi:MAG TPA: hypothetical protein VLV15_12385 [Dongiaceae bacterium]|nr:hypothetical protein [Dongiaceae bacterium]